MSDTSPFGFERFVPGFDFLQNLAKGAAGGVSSMPGLGNWIAPTMQVEDLQKRIDELKAVQFWLDQNSRALTATVQALEVQKMTLSTLKGMNVSMGDLASAFQRNAAEALQKVTEAPAKPEAVAPASAFASTPSPAPAAEPPAAPTAPGSSHAAEVPAASAGLIDPLQWWSALTTQFQQIAASALKDTAAQTSALGGTAMASGLATEAIKTATGMATQLASQGMQTMEVASQQVQRASSMAAAAAPRKAASKTSRAGAAPEAPSAAAKAPRRSTARKAGE